MTVIPALSLPSSTNSHINLGCDGQLGSHLFVTTLALAAQAAFGGPAIVVDGDTLRISGDLVRVFGVDAPEASQMCKAAASRVACGRKASEWLRSHIAGRAVQCVAVDQDRYGRMVARCSVQGVDLGRSLVEAGWATAYRKYSLQYVDAEMRAKAARRGIWALAFEQPEHYRRAKTAAVTPQVPPNPRCVLKGNISSTGARIYHTPGSRDYPKVRINLQKGERWFCSTNEAAAAGWRPVR